MRFGARLTEPPTGARIDASIVNGIPPPPQPGSPEWFKRLNELLPKPFSR